MSDNGATTTQGQSGRARLDKAMRQLEIAARKVIELGKDDAT